jgi:glycolate oxidase FAD binding subunit
MSRPLVPEGELELAELLASGGPFDLVGSASRAMLGRPMAEAAQLSMKHFSGFEHYEPEELVFEAGAATSLSFIEAKLRRKSQMLAFEPPDYSKVLAAAGSGTLGGLLATGFAGPRRIKAGSVRDHVLGVRGVTGRGEIFKGGARVVKNVTGYDLPKLMAGSWGTLAVLTSITFKVLPVPETEATIILPMADAGEAVAAMTRALQSPCEVSGAAFVPGRGVCLRLEGIAVSVKARRDVLQRVLQAKFHVLEGASSSGLWQTIRDVTAVKWNAKDIIWRVSLPPSEGASFVAAVAAKTDCRFLMDWGGGLVWLGLSAAPDGHEALVRGLLKNGHAMLFRAPAELRQTVSVFQPQEPALAALTRRVKAAMDPMGRLNPGRIYRGL